MMTARLMLATAAALSISAAASAADPAKPDLRDAGSQGQRELVLASADLKAPASVADAQIPPPAKKRIARVTTCRCGDPQPQNADQDSE